MTGCQFGLHALGIGIGARREVIDAVAVEAEAAGFATLWAGEHVVMVDEGASEYPYAPDGRIAVPAAADWLDPLIALSFAAAATQTIGLATGVLLLPEHQPLALAKRAASLDRLSGGRLTLGIGVGWSREEFDALGVPFARRGARADEYLAAIRAAWRDDVASFRASSSPFTGSGSIPSRSAIGGFRSSSAATARLPCDEPSARGMAGMAFNLDGLDEVRERIGRLRVLCRETGRDPRRLRIAVALADATAADPDALAAAGVDELVAVASPPADPAAVAGWCRALGPRAPA